MENARGGRQMDLYTKLDLDKDAMIRETQRLIRMKSVQEEPAGDMPFGKLLTRHWIMYWISPGRWALR